MTVSALVTGAARARDRPAQVSAAAPRPRQSAANMRSVAASAVSSGCSTSCSARWRWRRGVTCNSPVWLEWARSLPFPRGTVVEDRAGRRGGLMDGLIERSRDSDRIVTRVAFVRPLGGGHEWQAPFDELRAVGDA